MNSIICTLSLLSAVPLVQAAVLSPDQHWEAFKWSHRGKLKDMNQDMKWKFLAAKAAVDWHNANADKGLHSYKKEVNEFALMTDDELNMRMGAVAPIVTSSEPSLRTVAAYLTAPTSLDLRTSKCLPPIANQGECGSCWAFVATCPIEYQYCKLKKLTTPVRFSVQQLVDCDTKDSGCNGGWPSTAWAYLKTTAGLQTHADYPYISGANNQSATSCQYGSSKSVAQVIRYASILAGSNAVASIKRALATYGPVAAAIYASRGWTAYKSGIFSGSCSTSLVNHGVTIVGYGSEAGTDYWIVRNQWGSGWGEGGYIRMLMGANQCNIEKYAQFPVVKA